MDPTRKLIVKTNWVKIEDKLPPYYECVYAQLKSGEILEVWRASNGDHNIWTKFGSNQVYYDKDILQWARREVTSKEK